MTNNMCIRVLLGLVFFNCISGMKAEETAKTTATIHYQPAGGIFGDPIPFYHDGEVVRCSIQGVTLTGMKG